MPGQAKIISMITAALIMTTRLAPARVNTGISVFKCMHSEYDIAGTSSMLERVSLSYARMSCPFSSGGKPRSREGSAFCSKHRSAWHYPPVEVPGCVPEHRHYDNQTEKKRYRRDH